MHSALIWLRRDLRLADHPALHAALARGYTPIPVYVDDPQADAAGAASRWWLHHSLAALQKDLRQLGSDLFLLRGDSAAALLAAAKTTGARAVFWNRRYEPQSLALQQRIEGSLREAGLETQGFAAALLREPTAFGKPDNTPYRVFTPFWKALLKAGAPRAALPAPDALPPATQRPRGAVELTELQLLPSIAWYRGFSDRWQPGEAAAWSRLQGFVDNALHDYGRERDHPALHGTSRLSPHLHFGEITPAQVWHFIHNQAAIETRPGAVAAGEAFLRQLAWRDFAHHLLFHFPHIAAAPLDPRFEAFPWSSDYSDALARWQRGETGIPIVDAGLRELWSSGWMHNRVRMICASLLTKNLLIPWQRGERWFRDTLVDADLANNSFGWQWTAGCGADAAPYFRIFNPVTQGERFDSDGSYVRRWVPELERLPPKWIHKPWEAPDTLLSAAGITLDGNYPGPLVDLKRTRQQALLAWERVKQQRP